MFPTFADFSLLNLLPPLAFFVLLLLGVCFPLRRNARPLAKRWLLNALVAAPSLLLFKLALLPIPLATAVWAQKQGFGAFHWLHLPVFLEVSLGVAAFDFAYYWWHRGMHVVPVLWRFHAVHHLDPDMDATTAARFHVGELLLSVPFRCAVVAILGVNVSTILLYELLFELAALFHHSNWRLPQRLESRLSRLIITPRLHGIHHGDEESQANANWGTVLSCWDALHSTRRADVSQNSLKIGAPGHADASSFSLKQLLMLPFRKPNEPRA